MQFKVKPTKIFQAVELLKLMMKFLLWINLRMKNWVEFYFKV